MSKRYRYIILATIGLIVGFGIAASISLPSIPTLAPSPTTACHSINGLPDSNCTPGVVDPVVTQDNLHQTICVADYTSTIRPPVSYTDRLKLSQIKLYGYLDTDPSHYEEDHLIPLEVGGNPTDPKNLWPEPLGGTQGAHVKDFVENKLHSEVCAGSITLHEAQMEIVSNWATVK